jgi:succinyl-diaminopimelate desuccinylase
MDLMTLDDKDFIIEIAKRIIPVKSISPASGGNGEGERALVIENILKEMGFSDYKVYSVEDDKGIPRVSVVLKVGNMDRTVWLISHTDTVPEGDPKLWTRPPFEVTVDGNKIYGRGTSDDGQAVFLSFLLLKHLKKDSLKYNLGLAFVADEEVGSKYGIQYLLDQNIFRQADIIYVPDAGADDGMEMEIAEKSILWLQFTVKGKQYHASLPQNAINANRDGMEFILAIDKMLHEKYNAKDEIFNYPYSTFEPTKHLKNVDNINTIPGLETFFMDCRILPQYDLDNVIDDIQMAKSEFEQTHKSRITIDPVQKEQAPIPTPSDAEAVKLLKEALSKRGGIPRAVGIGGGTCAAFFRRKGMNAVVWSTTMPDVAHQVDEYCVIDHILMDRETLEQIIY